jgi:hypothetical protein
MRKLAPLADPVLRRIHELLPGPTTQAKNSTARRVLKRAYDENGAIFNGHFTRAILKLRDAGLVTFKITWNRERKCENLHVKPTPKCRGTLNRAQDAAQTSGPRLGRRESSV